MFMEKYFFHINEEPQFMLRRENDGYLMELIFESQIPKANWPAINRCRLYHKVLTLSDVITGTGDKIRQDIWTNQSPLTQDDRDDWPNQGNPSNADWQTWRQSLMTLFQMRAQDSAIALEFQLGAGKVTNSWKWYCDEDTIYEENQKIVTVYSQYGTRRSRRKHYRHSNTIQARPPQALPCTVERDRNNIVMTGKIIPEEAIATEDDKPPFIKYLQKKLKAAICPEQLIWMIYDNDPPSEDQMQQLKESMEREELIGCTDASTKNGISTASFKFQTKNRITVLQGEVMVPGDHEIQCSHRGEMGGAAAALTYLQLIIEYKNIQKGSVRFGCDSDNVVNIGLRQTSDSNSITEHYDLVRRCREARKAIQPIRIIPVNVKGHTDTLFRKKTTMEKLNIECDKRAGRRWIQASQENRQPEASQIGYWQLHHQGEPVLTQVPEKIRISIQEYTAYEYWTEKNYNPLRKETKAFEKVDWEIINRAMKSSSQYKRHFISKHATGHCGVGRMMKRWGFRKHDRCPRCKKADETALHVIQCQHATAREEWTKQFEQLQKWFDNQTTDPNISKAIIYNLKKWRKSGGLFPHHYQDKKIQRAVTEQKDIGWDQLMYGRISTRWSDIQLRYYKRQNSRKTGTKWGENFIKELWNMHWSIWNQRNEILHATGNHVVLGTKDLEREIESELEKGFDLLLPSERYLYQGIHMPQVRKWTAHKKKQWLRTIHSARYMSTIRHQETLPSRINMQNWLNG
jgi:hypothetical protein